MKIYSLILLLTSSTLFCPDKSLKRRRAEWESDAPQVAAIADVQRFVSQQQAMKQQVLKLTVPQDKANSQEKHEQSK